MIVDSGTVSSAISKLFRDNPIKTKAVATAVSGHSVIVKKITLPSMSDQELAETIEKEAAQHIPFDLADVSLDYQILIPTKRPADGRSSGRGQEGQDSELHQRTLDVRTSRLSSTSMRWPCRTATSTTTSRPGQDVALLNLGASVMNINIVKGTTPLFPRDVSVGGHQYTDSLQKELDLSFDDAESLKLGKK